MFRRLYRVRKAALRGKEVSMPAEVPMKAGDTVIALYDGGFVLYVPKGTIVNEELLIKAIRLVK